MTRDNSLYVNFKVVLPSKLSEERKIYIKKLIQTKTSDDSNITQQADKEIKFLDEVVNSELEEITMQINRLNVREQGSYSYQSEQETYDSGDEPVPGCNQQ